LRGGRRGTFRVHTKFAHASTPHPPKRVRSPIQGCSHHRRRDCLQERCSKTCRPAAVATVPASPPAQVGMLSKAGRSSDSQAQPAACLLASVTAFAAPSQWPDHSRPRRLDTAAGPSRNRTGVPCLPVESSCDRQATRFVKGNLSGGGCLSSSDGFTRLTGKLSHAAREHVKL
jgi:hypothetical protein